MQNSGRLFFVLGTVAAAVAVLLPFFANVALNSTDMAGLLSGAYQQSAGVSAAPQALENVWRVVGALNLPEGAALAFAIAFVFAAFSSKKEGFSSVALAAVSVAVAVVAALFGLWFFLSGADAFVRTLASTAAAAGCALVLYAKTPRTIVVLCGAFVGVAGAVAAACSDISAECANADIAESAKALLFSAGLGIALFAGTFCQFRLLANAFARDNFGRAGGETVSRVLPFFKAALVLVFVSACLGGTLSDETCGSFFVLDAESNGVLMLVLWITLVVHSARTDLFPQRGILALAVLCNIVAAWSRLGADILAGASFDCIAFKIFAIYAIFNLLCMPLALLKYRSSSVEGAGTR